MPKTSTPQDKKIRQEIDPSDGRKHQNTEPDPFHNLETEASQKALRAILDSQAKIYGERYRDSWIKRWYRIIGPPLCFILGAVSLFFLLASIYFGWPTNLERFDQIAPDLLPVLVSFSFVAVISITIAVLFSTRAGVPRDELGIMKVLARRLAGDQSEQE